MKTRRRETVASYHRRLTRRIAVLAEVQQPCWTRFSKGLSPSAGRDAACRRSAAAGITSIFDACHELGTRSDMHLFVGWKQMRGHSVAPDVMAYGALMRMFGAQGRLDKALDLLEEITVQMMMPVNGEDSV